MLWLVRGLMVIFGGAQALSIAWPWQGAWYGQSFGWLQWASLVGFAWFLDRTRSGKEALIRSWFFALAWMLGSVWWLWISLHVYGDMNAALAALAVVLLCAFMALIYGLAGWVYQQIRTDLTGQMWRASLFAACWTLAEWTRGNLFTGFPWAAGGYAHVDSVMHYWASWIGVYGLGAVSAWVAMRLACGRSDRFVHYEKYELALILLALLGVGVTGWMSALDRVAEQERTPLRVALVQGNVAQDVKFAQGAKQALLDYRQDVLNSSADLVVLPETAIPFFPHQLPAGYWSGLAQEFAKGDRALLTGIPLMKEDGERYTNSVVGLLAREQSYRYDKHHLVPFGEFVPPMFQWFIDWMHIPLGSFTRGDLGQAPLVWKGERLAANICYEDLFGEEIAKSFLDEANAPTILVNVSNLAWFGNTVALEQHLNIARMRSMEFHRPTIRATNTGVTAYIDEGGVVRARLPAGVRDVLQVKVRGVDGAPTPYAVWVGRWGLWPMVGLALLVLIVGAIKSYTDRHGRRRFGT
jgi:apolipoprotein N-acyltransferase